MATSLYLRPSADQPEGEPIASRSMDTAALPAFSVAPAELRKPPGLPPRSTSLGSAATTSGTASEPRVSVYSTNGTVYERAAVVGHSLGSDGVVYYLLEVRSWESPLEGYVVRRRYNDFKRFHEALAQWMPPEAGRARSVSSSTYGVGLGAGAGSVLGGFSSLLLACSPIASTPEASPLLLSPTSTYSRRRSASSNPCDDKQPSTANGISTEETPEQEASCESPMGPYTPRVPVELRPGATYYDRTASLPLDEVKFTLSGRARLPELPSGGLLTSAFLSAASRAQLIADRMTSFNRILAAALSDSSAQVAHEVMLFVQEKPDALAHSYTSLAEYAAISMPFTVERRARRRAMSMGRQLRDQHSTDSASGSVGTPGR